MKERKIRIFRYGITTVFLLSLLYLADLGRIAAQFSSVDITTYLLAVGVFLTIYFWSAFRWKSLTDGLGYSIGAWESAKIIAMSYGFNKMLPLNSGDLTRSKLMERYARVSSHGEILGAVAMERMLDVMFLGAISAISAVYLLGGTGVTTLLVLIAAVLVGFMVLIRVRADLFLKILERLSDLGMPERLSGLLEESLEGYRDIPLENLAEVSIWHTLRWAAGIMVLYLLSVSLGHPISLAGAALATAVMSLVSAMPITPAGIGPVEALGTGILIVLGLSPAEAAALVVLQRSLGFVLMAVIGSLVYSLG
ncbi:MAG: YbhN family protein [Candidatus Nanosalina sp.]